MCWEETEIPPCASLRLLATVLRDANFQGTVYMSQELLTARKAGWVSGGFWMLVGVLRVYKTVTEKWKQSLERGGRSIGEQWKILESVDGDNL